MPSSARDAKRQGELAEVLFVHRAMSLGLRVSKPYGESNAYDFVVDWRGALRRVQVKSVAVAQAGAYRVGSGSGRSSKRAYTPADIDVLAAYVIPEDTWYLIPVGAFAPVKSIHLCPGRVSKRRFEQYREAWEVLGAEAAAER
jgi:long-subunit fatty acid transport protein